MAGIGSLYDAARAELGAQVATLPAHTLAQRVPATPDWSIHDVIAHLASIATGLATGDYPSSWFAGVGEPAAISELNDWTHRHVAARRSASTAQVIDEWESGAARIRPWLIEGHERPPSVLPFAEYVLLTDLTAHRCDVQVALGVPINSDEPGIRVATKFYLSSLPAWQPHLPALLIDVGEKIYSCGSGEPRATLTTDRFTLFRSLSGRRTERQIRDLDWSGDPEPFLQMFAPYGPREIDLYE